LQDSNRAYLGLALWDLLALDAHYSGLVKLTLSLFMMAILNTIISSVRTMFHAHGIPSQLVRHCGGLPIVALLKMAVWSNSLDS